MGVAAPPTDAWTQALSELEREPTRITVLEPDEVMGRLGVDAGGLTAQEAGRRLASVGPNRIHELPGPSLARRLAAQFFNLFAVLLWVGSVLAFVVGMPSFGIAIVAVIVLNGIFGFFQEYRAERAVTALKRLLPPLATVMRDGGSARITAEELVPGDVLVLEEGDRVSADARLIEAVDMRADESSLTGEAHPVHKTSGAERRAPDAFLHAHNMLFAGSSIVAGGGRAVVVATAMRTEFGKIAELTQAVPAEPSPLQREVTRVARRVAVLSIVMGAVFFAIGYLFAGLPLRDGAIFAIGIVLANVPEGLLPTMTLALAMGVQRMAKRQAIVKRLSSVETLGSCTVICTDKTGTITKNQMTVRELWASGRVATLTGTGYEPVGAFLVDGRLVGETELVAFLPTLRIGHMCNTATLQRGDDEGAAWRATGDPTEIALLVAAAKAGLDRAFDLRLRPTVRRLAFDPRRKRMSTIHRALPQERQLVAYVKGAPRELLEHCASILVDGREVPLTEELRGEVMSQNDRMARQGMRVLAMAYRYLPPESEPLLATVHPGRIEEELTFTGLAGLQDPPRDEVPDAVERCRSAGIRTVMITGDYGLTAESIARQVGMLGEGPALVIDAGDLEAMSDDELRDVVAREGVLFARATPEHKLRIVVALRSLGEVVAVTGDGVNDAPALRRADIGVAMGLAGTDVAREAADMVLVDDNFATIVAAVEEGRVIFDNMRKFIVYIFAHLSPEAVPFIFYALFRIPQPITVMQILAIDLGTETLPALALGVERAEPDVMSRPPRQRTDRLLGAGALLRGYGFLGLLSSAVVMVAYFAFLRSVGWHWGSPEAPTSLAAAQATTIVFLGIVVMQVGNAFACRTERASVFTIGLFSNRFLLLGIGFELLFAASLIYVSFLQPIFGTAAIPAFWWGFFALFVPVIFLAEEARKAFVRGRAARRRHGAEAPPTM